MTPAASNSSTPTAPTSSNGNDGKAFPCCSNNSLLLLQSFCCVVQELPDDDTDAVLVEVVVRTGRRRGKHTQLSRERRRRPDPTTSGDGSDEGNIGKQPVPPAAVVVGAIARMQHPTPLQNLLPTTKPSKKPSFRFQNHQFVRHTDLVANFPTQIARPESAPLLTEKKHTKGTRAQHERSPKRESTKRSDPNASAATDASERRLINK